LTALPADGRRPLAYWGRPGVSDLHPPGCVPPQPRLGDNRAAPGDG
jgi:hypothetical protein